MALKIACMDYVTYVLTIKVKLFWYESADVEISSFNIDNNHSID